MGDNVDKNTPQQVGTDKNWESIALRQNLLFSATLGKDVHTITEMLLHHPVKIEITPEAEHAELIKQVAYRVTDERKGPLLRYLIKEQNLQQ